MTPLHIASLNLHIKIVSVLLKENQVGTRVLSLMLMTFHQPGSEHVNLMLHSRGGTLRYAWEWLHQAFA